MQTDGKKIVERMPPTNAWVQSNGRVISSTMCQPSGLFCATIPALPMPFHCPPPSPRPPPGLPPMAVTYSSHSSPMPADWKSSRKTSSCTSCMPRPEGRISCRGKKVGGWGGGEGGGVPGGGVMRVAVDVQAHSAQHGVLRIACVRVSMHAPVCYPTHLEAIDVGVRDLEVRHGTLRLRRAVPAAPGAYTHTHTRRTHTTQGERGDGQQWGPIEHQCEVDCE